MGILDESPVGDGGELAGVENVLAGWAGRMYEMEYLQQARRRNASRTLVQG